MAESTTMKVYFNSLGVISSTNFADVPLRQGSVGIKLETYFDGVDNALYTATLNFTRSNGSSIAGLVMGIDNENSECYTYKFSDVWFFAKAGTTTLTIYLRDGRGNVIAQGQVTFNIERTDYEDDPLITINQYNNLLSILASKIGVPQSSLRVDELPVNGQPNIFYVVHDDPNDSTRTNIYIWNDELLTYIWVGSNELDLNKYYTKLEGQDFEDSIEERVTDIENEVLSVAGGSPKGVYSTLSALQAAYPTGTTGIYVVTADGHWYYWNGTQWTDGGVYQATQISPSSIDFKELNTEVNERLENLGFKGKKIYATFFDGYVKYDDGTIASDNRMCYSDFVYIKSFYSLYATGTGGYGPIAGISFYDKNKNYLKSISFNTATSKYLVLDGNEDYSNAVYCRISAYNNSQDYSNTYLQLFSRQDVDYLNLNGRSRRKLWKDLDTKSFNMTVTGFIYSSDGTLRNLGACTDFIEIGNRKKIFYNSYIVFGSNEYMLVAFYDKDKNYIKGIGVEATSGTPASGDIDISGSAYDDAVYVRVSCNDASNMNKTACVLYPFDEIAESNLSPELQNTLLGDSLAKYRNVKYNITNPGLDFDSSGRISGSANPNADRGLTDRIPLSNFKKLVISTTYNGRNVWFYNKNNVPIYGLEVGSAQNIIDIDELKQTYPTIDNCIVAAFWGNEGNSPRYYAIGICKYDALPLKKFDNKNLLIFGDSITDSCNFTVNSSNETTAMAWRSVGDSAFQYRQMWAAILRNKYSWKEVRNYALSGATWRGEIVAGNRNHAAAQVQIAINDKLNPHSVFNQADFTPDVIVFAFGANDGTTVSDDSYETAMSKTVLVSGSENSIDVEATLNNLDKTKLYQAIRWCLLKIKYTFPLAQVYVSLPIQGAKFYPDEMAHSQLCEAIKKMAERCGCIVINSTAESGIIPEGNFYNPSSLGQTLQDGLHPNKVGQQLLARAIASSLESHFIDLDTFN